jgi:hypothetical protein
LDLQNKKDHNLKRQVMSHDATHGLSVLRIERIRGVISEVDPLPVPRHGISRTF